MRTILQRGLLLLTSLASAVYVHSADPATNAIIRISATDNSASESGPSTGLFTIIRSGNTNVAVNLSLTVSGSALAGEDYVSLSNQVALAAGERRAFLLVTPIDDAIAEPGESVTVRILTDPANNQFVLEGDGVATVAIADNDVGFVEKPTVVIKASDPWATEGTGAATFTISRIGATNAALTVELGISTNAAVLTGELAREHNLPPLSLTAVPAAAPGDDYDVAGTVTLEAGKREVAVTIRPKEDAVFEGLESISLFIKTNSAFNLNYPAAQASAFIADNDPDPNLIVVTVSASKEKIAEATEEAAAFVFARRGPTNLPVEVQFAISGTAGNGTDYQRITNVVTIPAGAVNAEVRIAAKLDVLTVVEPNETVTVTVQPPACAAIFPRPPGCYAVGDRNRATITITEFATTNKPPTVSIVSPEKGAVFFQPVNVRIVASPRDSDGGIRRIDFYANEALVGSAEMNPLAMAPFQPYQVVWTNAPVGTHRLVAKAIDDLGATGASEPVEITVKAAGEGRNRVEVVASDAESREPSVNGTVNRGTVRFVRSGLLNFPLTVVYSISGTAENGVDYNRLQQSAVIPEGRESVEMSITPLGDTKLEGRETVILTIEPPVCPAIEPPPASCYLIGARTQAVVHISDPEGATGARPSVAILTPTNHAVFATNAPIAIQVKAVDEDGYIQGYRLFANERLINQEFRQYLVAPPNGEPAVFDYTWTNAAPGRYNLVAWAVDDRGVSNASPAVQITVGTVITEHAPKVQILAPTNLSRFPANADITVRAEAVDEDGYITGFRLLANGRELTSESRSYLVPPPDGEKAFFEFKWTNVASGQYTLRLLAVDDSSRTNASNEVNILVGEDSNVNRPVVNVSSPDREAREGNPPDTAKFVVSRSGSRTNELLVFLRISGTATNGIDYQEIDSSVLIPAGAEAATIILTPKGDDISEGTETVVVTVIPVPPNVRCVNCNYSIGSNPSSSAFIRDATGNEAPIAIITQPRSGTVLPGPARVTLKIETVDRDGYVPKLQLYSGEQSLGVLQSTNTNSFNATWEYTMTNLPPGNYRFTARATDNAGASKSSEAVNITVTGNFPVVGVSASDATASEDPTTNTGRFTIYRSGSRTNELPVYFSISGSAEPGVDFKNITSPVRIPAGAEAVHITVEAVKDSETEGTETVILTLAAPPANPESPTYLISSSSGKATVSITEPRVSQGQEVSIYVKDGRASEVAFSSGEVNSAALVVKRTGSTAQPLTVNWSIRGTASNGVDYVKLPNSTTIPANESSVEVRIVAIRDELTEPAETVTIQLENPPITNVQPPQPPAYLVVGPGHASVEITDRPADGTPKSAIKLLAGDEVEVASEMELTKMCVLETSVDLIDWTPVSFVAPDSKPMQFIEKPDSSSPRKFYRLRAIDAAP